MKREKSCGAVIFQDGPGGRTYLTLRSTKGHTTLCKGHVEGEETERQTAVREIREETGLTVDFVDGFREVISYSPRAGHWKDVVFFLASVAGGTPVCQPEEVAELRFLPFAQAVSALTHDSDRDVLRKADAFLWAR